MPKDDRPPGEIVNLDAVMQQRRRDDGNDSELQSLAASFVRLLVIEDPDAGAMARMAAVANSLATTPATTLSGLRFKLVAIMAHVLKQHDDHVAVELLMAVVEDLDALDGGPGGPERRGAG